MAGTGERFFVRRKNGDRIGPFAQPVIATMLAKGKLDGSEEISTDGIAWRPVKEPASPEWGERDLGDASGIALEPLDAVLGAAESAAAQPEPAKEPAGGGGPALLELSTLDLAPLELAFSPADEKKKAEAAPNPESGTAPGTAPTLAPLVADEPAALPATPRTLEPSAPAYVEETLGSRPLTSLDPGEIETAMGGALPGAGGRGEGEATEESATEAAQPAPRSRTLTAAKPRPPAPPKRSRKALLVAAGGVALLGVAVGLFVAFDLGDRLIGEPAAESILGSAAADILADRYPAYDHGAKLLVEAVASRPRSVRLRAAAAELLASSVVLRRGDRARLAKAEAILAEAPTAGVLATAARPDVARARAWIALGKGRPRDATRALDEGGAPARNGASALLLSSWMEMAQHRWSAAEALFRRGMGEQPSAVAFRHGLARAQEEADKADDAVSYKQVLATAPQHFGAALGLVRVGHYAPAARLTLLTKLVADHGAEASRAELGEARAMQSTSLRLLGKSADAEAALEKGLASDPASPSALVAAGDTLLEEGRLREAVAKYRQAVPEAPAVPVSVPGRGLRYAVAAVLIESGRAADGLTALGPATGGAGGDSRRGRPSFAGPSPSREVRNPSEGSEIDAVASFWRGRAAELKTPPDLTAAARSYEETLAADPRFVPAALQLAALLIQQKRVPEGLAVLQRTEKAGAPAAELDVALGQALLTAGDLERAKKAFRDLLAKNPRNTTARLGLAAALEAGGNLTAAKNELELLLGGSPDLPGLRPRMADLLAKVGDRERALVLYRAEIDAGKATLATRLAAANLALKMGRAGDAQALAEKLVTDAPETPGALLALGQARRAGGDLAGALAEFRRALAFENTPILHFEIASVLAALGKEEPAMAEYEQAAGLPEAAIARARILLARGDLDRPVALLEGALKQVPESAEAWLLLGNAHDRLAAPAKAVTAWKQAARFGPDSSEAHYRLGRWEMDRGQPAAALARLRDAAAKLEAKAAANKPSAKQQPWTADLYYQLGFAEKAKGSRPAAAVALKKYLTLAPPEAPARRQVEKDLAEL